MTPKGVKVAGHNNRFVGALDETVEIMELGVSNPIPQRQVHQENNHVIEFEFDDQFFRTLAEIVKPFSRYRVLAQERIAPLVDHRDPVCEAGLPVLGAIGMIVAEGLRDASCLAHTFCPVRAIIDLEQTHNVGIHRVHEINDGPEIVGCTPEVSAPRKDVRATACGVSDVINQ